MTGHYPLAAAAELPPALREAWLEPVVIRGQPHYRVHDSLRTRVQFSRRDAMATPIANDSAAPEKRFDLVSCRNVLIYLQAVRSGARHRAAARHDSR